MFIKNQTFKDEETLIEVLFDFGLGTSTPLINDIVAGIDQTLEGNDSYIKYRDSIQDIEERLEFVADERAMRLADQLLQQFDSFTVYSAKLYGNKGEDKTLLYEMDLY
jgi:hypothetical protein